MSDRHLNDAFLRGERERLEKWLLDTPEPSPKPSNLAQQPPTQKDSRNILQQAADVIYPPTPPVPGAPERSPLGTIGEKVAERFAEGVNQLKTGLTGASEPARFGTATPTTGELVTGEKRPAFESKALGVVRDVGIGAFNAALPFGAAAGYIGGELQEYFERENGGLTDDVLKVKLSYARLHAPELVPIYERWLALPYDERLRSARANAEFAAEVASGVVPGYTGAANTRRSAGVRRRARAFDAVRRFWRRVVGR